MAGSLRDGRHVWLTWRPPHSDGRGERKRRLTGQGTKAVHPVGTPNIRSVNAANETRPCRRQSGHRARFLSAGPGAGGLRRNRRLPSRPQRLPRSGTDAVSMTGKQPSEETPRWPQTTNDRPALERGGPASHKTLERTLFEVNKVVVGQDRMTEAPLRLPPGRGTCCWRRPRAAKTLAAERWPAPSAASSPGCSSPPDSSRRLVSPASTGVTESVRDRLGRCFANVVLADEINRPRQGAVGPARGDGERHVSIGGPTFAVPDPSSSWRPEPMEHEGVLPPPRGPEDGSS